MTPTTHGSITRLRNAPALVAGAFVVLELGVLYLVSHQRYVPLTRSENAPVLVFAHELSQVLATGVVLALALAAWRRVLGAPGIAGRRARAGLWAGHLAAFAGLCALYPVLPHFSQIDPVLSRFEIGVLAAMVGAFFVFLGTGFALAMPAAFRPYWRSPMALAVLGLGLLAVTAVASSSWFTIATIRRPIEDATLAMSVAFYTLTGLPEPTLDFSGIDPVMQAAGFAIIIAPVCSGYQGIFSALAILGGYVGLERRALRLRRAALLVAGAVALVFVLNAARIALLFAIGVSGRPDVAVGGFHSNFGVLSLLTVVALAILALETAPFRKGRASGQNGRPSVALPAAELETIGRLGLPLAGLMAASILVGLSAGTVNWLYPVSAAVGAGLLWLTRADLMARLDPGPTATGFLAGVGVFVAWVWMVPPDPEASRAFATALMAAPVPLVVGWIAVRVIGASVIVPLVEELAFRAGLVRLVEGLAPARWPRWGVAGLALAVSSVAFGLLHSTILAGIMAGVVYGALALWRGSLADAILAHMVTNFLLVLTVLGLGHWSYW